MSDLLNNKELAASLKRSVSYVTGMKHAGYEFKHKSLGRTTAEHALAWLDHNTNFVAFDYIRKGWKRLPKLPAAPMSPAA